MLGETGRWNDALEIGNGAGRKSRRCKINLFVGIGEIYSRQITTRRHARSCATRTLGRFRQGLPASVTISMSGAWNRYSELIRANPEWRFRFDAVIAFKFEQLCDSTELAAIKEFILLREANSGCQ